METLKPIVIVISADAEWHVVQSVFSPNVYEQSPYGEWFLSDDSHLKVNYPVVFFHGGWGKVRYHWWCGIDHIDGTGYLYSGIVITIGNIVGDRIGTDDRCVHGTGIDDNAGS